MSMPPIQPNINREPERKRPAWLLSLLGAGAEGTQGFGVGFIFNGMLATKTGVVTLALVGSTLAGGVGYVGYRAVIVGTASDGNPENLSVFQARPQAAASAAAASAPAEGTSESLKMLASANTAAPSADAGGAASAGSSDGSSGNSNGTSASVTPHPALTAGKFGKLSDSAASGKGASVTSAAPNHAAADAAALAAAQGRLSSGAKNARADGSSVRGIAGRRSFGAMQQAMGTLSDNRGASSSYSAGRTYDAGAANVNAIGAGGNAIGMAGVGAGSQPKSIPGPSNGVTDKKDIPAPATTDVTPWQAAINGARDISLLAIALLYLASTLGKGNLMYAKIIGWTVAAMGLYVISLGAQIAHGQYAQTAQGSLIAAAGIGLVIAGAMVGMASNGTKMINQSNPAVNGAINSEGTMVEDASTNSAFGNGSFAQTDMLIKIGGGVAIAGMVGTMMAKSSSVPASSFPSGQAPDIHTIFGMNMEPSRFELTKIMKGDLPLKNGNSGAIS